MPIAAPLQCHPTNSVDYGLVSVIMPNHNSNKYVKATIQSVLDQTYQNWEIVFVDDCSTDNSLDIVRSFDDSRIRIFQNETNCGAAVARNKAIAESRGRWIAFLDSDDLWYPQKLENQLAYMYKNSVSFSYTDYDIIDDNNNIISSFKPGLSVCSYKDLLKHNHIGCLTVIYDVDKLGKVYMPVDAVKREDLACWLSISKTGENMHCLHESLAQYKIHSGSVSSNKIKMVKYQWLVYKKVEKLNVFISAYYLVCWGIKGLFKYK